MSEEHAFYKLQSVSGFREAEQNDSQGEKESIRPQSVEYSSSWLNFLIVLCLLVAWYFPLKILVSYWVWPTVDRGVRDSSQFVALTYEGVSEKDKDVSPEQFQEHLDALIANGYNPITIAEVRDLYQKGEPLPRKAVLLTFDHSRKSSFFDTRSAIRRSGWFATMFLWVKPIEDMDRATLLWPYLRAMLRGDSWEVSAQSFNGFAKIPASPEGETGNFMTTPQWLDDQDRYETLTEFSERLGKDHEKCIALIKDHLGVEPIAYSYPYGDFGQFKSASTVIHAINLALVEQNYDLGFLTGNLALNTRYSDPRRLNRLLVDPSWDGEQLVNHLDKCWPLDSPARNNVGASELPWVVDWGEIEQTVSGHVAIFAPEETTGAKMWLAGSDLNKDFYAKVRFRLTHGQLGLYMRATPDSESYVYLGLDTGGDVWLRQLQTEEDKGQESPQKTRVRSSDVWLRQKEITTERFTLASAHVEIQPQTEHVIEVYLRENLLFARLDGGQLFKQRAILRGQQRPGMFGLSIWAPTPGRARATIENVELHQQDMSMLCWNANDPDYNPYMFKWVHDNAYRLTDFSPKWLSIDTLGRIQQSTIEPSTYSLLARINHLNLYPRVTIDEENDLSVLTPQLLAKRLTDAGVDGVYIDMKNYVEEAGKGVLNWLTRTANSLGERGMDLVMDLPRTLESKSNLLSILAMMPNGKVVVEKDSQLATDPELQNEAIVEKEELSQPVDRSQIPIFYQIESLAGGTFEESVESKTDRLYNEGMASYQAGDYDAALRSWLEWLEIEPENSKVLMLLGDVEARRGNIDDAIAYYDRSLEIDPGQITLELRRIRLLDMIGREDEAVKSLNVYARLFPANTDILIAQAEWLERHDRTSEALDVARKVLALEPENMKALAFMLLYSDLRQERIEARDSLIDIGQNPNRQFELGKLIWDYELLTLDISEPLIRMASNIAAESEDSKVRDIFLRLRPRYTAVSETFDDGEISDDWWILGGSCTLSENRALLRSSRTHKEVSMRLLGSLHLSHAYIETALDNVQGDFWIYARRSANHMIRFGFTSEQKIYLQVWMNGQLASNQSKAWTKPARPFKMRLEVCADGIIGSVDGKIVFSPYLSVPASLGQGWIGIASSSQQPGSSSATIASIEAGPTPPRIALLEPAISDETSDRQLQTIRQSVSALTAISPAWYAVDMGGNWNDNYSGDKELYRLFSRYYRFWLMPTVKVGNIASVDALDIKTMAEEYRVDGFVLMLDDWPREEWIEKMNAGLSGSDVKLVIARMDSSMESVALQGLGAGREIFSNRSISRDYRVYNSIELPEAAKSVNRNNPLVFRL